MAHASTWPICGEADNPFAMFRSIVPSVDFFDGNSDSNVMLVLMFLPLVNRKFTPLHEAAAKGKFDICKLLLKHGADPNKKNRDGHTPLDLVKEGDEDVADLLRGEAALLEAAKKG